MPEGAAAATPFSFAAVFRRIAEILQDRTIRPVIAVALVGEVLQNVPHFGQVTDLFFELRDMGHGNLLHLPARPAPVRPEDQKIGDLLHRKAKSRALLTKRNRWMSDSLYSR